MGLGDFIVQKRKKKVESVLCSSDELFPLSHMQSAIDLGFFFSQVTCFSDVSVLLNKDKTLCLD